MKSKASEQKRLEMTDTKFTKACATLKALEFELSREKEEYQSLLLSSPEKLIPRQPPSNAALMNIQKIGKLLGTVRYVNINCIYALSITMLL